MAGAVEGTREGREAGRAHWGSKFGFVLAAAGSAIGLGTIWKFPYIAGENGGGLFVLIYLGCILLVGLPIMMAEILIGRGAQRSPVGAFKALSSPRSPWIGIGWLGVLAAFVILSYYSVVAGWAIHYVWLSVRGAFRGLDAEQVGGLFTALYTHPGSNLLWHTVFMTLTMGIVVCGIHKGVERWSEILMPILFLMLLVMLGKAYTMDGFGRALRFVFWPNAERLTRAGVLEALGHSFFTLSLGMGVMITYGSYLHRRECVVTSSLLIAGFDTLIALMACLILFPITFTFDMQPEKSVGLVFINLPIAFSQMPGGHLWSVLFFVLLTFAALTSAISILEVTVSYFIDEWQWSRRVATVVCGLLILGFGVPSALSGGTALFGKQFQSFTTVFGFAEGKNWFDFFDYLASNWMLPLGGLGIALFMAWRVSDASRAEAFQSGTRLGRLYWGWLQLLRYLVPLAVLAVFLHAVGLV